MTREPIEVTRQDRIYCLKVSSDYHSEVCEECKFYPNCDHMTQDDMTELTIKDLETLEQEPTTKNDLPHCQHTDEEIAKSFIEDVETVEEQFPCGEQMDFPKSFDDFVKDYGFKDKEEVYTNGSELIPVFRVKQWLEHISATKNDLGVDCISRAEMLKYQEYLHGKMPNEENYKLWKFIKDLPSVTPLSSGLEKNSKKLEKNFGESDCISRQAVLDLIADYDLSMGQVVRGIHALPPINPQEPRWIPVSERLPNSEYGESDSVLVCFENETQDVLYFDGSNWCYPTGETYISVNPNNDWHNKVVAWMSLPKAYREKQSNKVGWSSLENVREKVERGTEK